MKKHAIIILADGFEEVEAITPVDLLRRAGIKVTMLGLASLNVRGSHDIIIAADMLFDSFSGDFDALILPGGPGYKNLLDSPKVMNMIVSAYQQNKLCAAICAAPTVLGKAGILKGRRATCFPGYEAALGGAIFVDKKVATDNTIITSRGAGTAVDFGLEIITWLIDKNTADSVAEKIVYR